MVLIIGKAHIAYLPRNRVVGISKLARVMEVFAKRLQFKKINSTNCKYSTTGFDPKGVAVVIEFAHQWMTTRGIKTR